MFDSFDALRNKEIGCRLCPRLVEFRESIVPRKSYECENYWKRPVPGYGDPQAWLLILGLAPAAHGGNRTGRLFTGDQSSKFLMEALYETGLANQPTSEYFDDGLILNGCFMTAVVKCVPPKDKPTTQEMLTCNPYFQNELLLLKNLTHILALGKFAFDSYHFTAKGMLDKAITPTKFAHGQKYITPGLPTLYTSYHPSPQNTNTGKLTRQMFLDLLNTIKNDHTQQTTFSP